MANSLFLIDDQVRLGTVTASSQAGTTMAPGNLQTAPPSEFWRSADGQSSSVFVTLADAVGVTHGAAINVNFTTAATIRLRGWSDAMNGSTLVYDQTFYPTLYIEDERSGLDLGEGDFGEGSFGSAARAEDNISNITLMPLGATFYDRYWRYDFEDLEGDFQQVGRIVMAPGLEFENNLSYGWDGEYDDLTVEQESPGGQMYREERPRRLILRGSFDLLTEAERTRMFMRLRNLGTSVPFIYSVFPEPTNRGMTSTVYGTFTQSVLGNPGPRANSLKFSVRQEL